MLICVSDLHFTDGTSSRKNIDVNMLERFITNISLECSSLENAQEIKIIFLGDIFDLFRTTHWFHQPEEERPWGYLESEIEQHSNYIFDSIIKRNQAVFDILGSELKDTYNLPCEPERIFIPGNHDRLCNKYQSLRDKVCKSLRIPIRNIPFETTLLDLNYSVFARHGHEFDPFNYEGSTPFTYEDSIKTTIGEVVTTELIEKFPWMMMNNPIVNNLSEEERNILQRNFQEIEDIRPLSSVIEWIVYQSNNNPKLKYAIEQTMDIIVKDFNNIGFVKEWFKKHNKWYSLSDPTDIIQVSLFLINRLNVLPLHNILPILGKLKFWQSKDSLIDEAQKELDNLNNIVTYIIYGHTHINKQIPLKVINDKKYYYFNTGSWNTSYYKTEQGSGFVGLQYLNYLVFYLKEELHTEYPIFETNSITTNGIEIRIH